MSLFSNILQKLGLKKPEAPAPTASTLKPAPKPVAPQPVTQKPVAAKVAGKTFQEENDLRPARPAAIPVVDVVAKLEEMAKSKPGLDWKVSIVDLLKLLDIDSSYNARKELATELGCPANFMNDSAAMNTWLHKTVLQKIAENGGNIPQSLL